MRLALMSLLMIPLTLGCDGEKEETSPDGGSDCADGFGLAEDGYCYPIDPTPSDDRVEGTTPTGPTTTWTASSTAMTTAVRVMR